MASLTDPHEGSSHKTKLDGSKLTEEPNLEEETKDKKEAPKQQRSLSYKESPRPKGSQRHTASYNGRASQGPDAEKDPQRPGETLNRSASQRPGSTISRKPSQRPGEALNRKASQRPGEQLNRKASQRPADLSRKTSKRDHDDNPQRPGPPKRTETYHSRYVQMLLKQDHIPRLHNILAAFFVWVLLAGFLVFPGTFTSIRESIDERENNEDIDDPEVVREILRSVKNVPLLVIAIVCCGVGAIGMISLAFRHVRNYIWLINRLLIPGMANSVAGLISSLIAVYSQKDGEWSVTAKITTIVEGGYLVACAALFLIVERYFLHRVRQKHGNHYDRWFGIGEAAAAEEAGESIDANTHKRDESKTETLSSAPGTSSSRND